MITRSEYGSPAPRHPGRRPGLSSASLLLALSIAPLEAATHPRLVITPTPGFSIAWDGNNGGFNNPAIGAGPSNNVALASNGTAAFTSSDLGPLLNIPFHVAANLNDGLYGNANSWISANGVGGATDPDPYAALRFPADVDVSSIAWGRDNGNVAGDCCGGTLVDRTVGTYTLQYTGVAIPDGSTPETEDSATGWATIGRIEFRPGAEDVNFTSYLRHRFDVAEGGSPINATGLRIKVSNGSMDIDELEVNPIPDPIPPVSNFIEITPAAGYGIAWDKTEGAYSTTANPAPAPANDASASRGATAFGSTELGPVLGISHHRFLNIIDGQYGNSFSWIPNFIGGDSRPFVGVAFGRRVLVNNLAWSRDNGNVAGDCCGGTLTDRTLGVYTVQVTTAANPSAATPDACGPNPDSGWVTVGTIHYKGNDPVVFNSYLRHRFDLTQGGAPIPATAVRLLVPNASIAIDELEVNTNPAIESGAVTVVAAEGSSITWDGLNGQFYNPAIGASPPQNPALAAEGTTPFTSSDLGPLIGVPFHRAVNLNDGLYGNANSWISGGGGGQFAGLNFGAIVQVASIAWSRDNGNVAGDCCGGTLTDRSLGAYTIQFTAVASPDATTAETGDADTGWQDLGTVTYVRAVSGFFGPHLRHRFEVSNSGNAIDATGIRIKISDSGIAIDEIEINTPARPASAPSPVTLTPAAGYTLAWDGNNGQYQSDAVGAAPPLNRALASAGSTPLTSSDLGPLLGIPFHVAANVNDGLYGNARSWISANGVGGNTDPNPSAGVIFNGLIQVSNLAWSRDNGDAAEGTFTDRNQGTYTIQVTAVAAPDGTTPETGDAATGWITIGTVTYSGSSADFTPHLRHRFDVSAGGQPIEATALRLKTPDGFTCIDELEVNTATTPPPPHINIARSGATATITWSGGGGLECAPTVNGPWACVGAARSDGYTVSFSDAMKRFYRVRR